MTKKRNNELFSGDVPATEASMEGLENAIDYRPTVPIEQGIKQFVTWYRDYYLV